ncbi:MAG: GLPGLI family protein [Cyclobacteriaceae bacterium]|nr:GLPGLI family protein [Cytophagales bacterium]MCZ8327488.1 GLPGLI family protein [Cyclobacteriaceae bacterium]
MTKKLLLIIGLLTGLAAMHTVMAQSGLITYEQKVNLHRRLPADRQEMKAMIPEFRTTKFTLAFNQDESLYKSLPEDEEEPFGNGQGVQVRFNMPKSETYVRTSDMKFLQKQEFMGREYLIVDSVKTSPWKFGTETKIIHGYECKQAYYTAEPRPNVKEEITAWYTEKIRPFLGPEQFNTLPGAVLAVDVNNGERVYVVQKIELRELKKNELKVPEGGQKVTRKEYRDLVDEQMRKMNANGGMIIRN